MERPPSPRWRNKSLDKVPSFVSRPEVKSGLAQRHYSADASRLWLAVPCHVVTSSMGAEIGFVSKISFTYAGWD